METACVPVKADFTVRRALPARVQEAQCATVMDLAVMVEVAMVNAHAPQAIPEPAAPQLPTIAMAKPARAMAPAQFGIQAGNATALGDTAAAPVARLRSRARESHRAHHAWARLAVALGAAPVGARMAVTLALAKRRTSTAPVTASHMQAIVRQEDEGCWPWKTMKKREEEEWLGFRHGHRRESCFRSHRSLVISGRRSRELAGPSQTQRAKWPKPLGCKRALTCSALP